MLRYRARDHRGPMRDKRKRPGSSLAGRMRSAGRKNTVSKPRAAKKAPRAPAAPIQPGVPIVAIGASAGGLDAFRRFLAGMPVPNGMAFVLIQHLDPTHESLMVELLAKHTTMRVVEVRQGMEIEVHHVYVIPPHRVLSWLLRRPLLPVTRRGPGREGGRHHPHRHRHGWDAGDPRHQGRRRYDDGAGSAKRRARWDATQRHRDGRSGLRLSG